MCDHKKIIVIPSIENSWGIADTYHIKCQVCGIPLYESITSNEVENYVKKHDLINVVGLWDNT